jgi:hypothetical protein
MLFDWLVIGQVIPMNPAASVRGPKYVTKRGKTHVLSAEDARLLLDSISLTRRVKDEQGVHEVPNLVGLRDRALISVMVFSFARVSAVAGMRVSDYYQNGKRCWFRLHEKGGKFHEVPAHHNAVTYVDEYLKATGIVGDLDTPLFRSVRGKTAKLTAAAVSRMDAFRMVKRRAEAVGLSPRICCHTFRATGITAYLSNGGTIDLSETDAITLTDLDTVNGSISVTAFAVSLGDPNDADPDFNFSDPLTIIAESAGGEVNIEDDVVGNEDDADLTIFGSGDSTKLKKNIDTNATYTEHGKVIVTGGDRSIKAKKIEFLDPRVGTTTRSIVSDATPRSLTLTANGVGTGTIQIRKAIQGLMDLTLTSTQSGASGS